MNHKYSSQLLHFHKNLFVSCVFIAVICEMTDTQIEEEKQEGSTVVMWINIDCDGCCKKVYRAFQNIQGVQEIEIDRAQNRVIVKGTMEPEDLIKRLAKKTGKTVKLLKVEKKQKQNEECELEQEEEYCYHYLPAEIHSTEQPCVWPNNSMFFSEEDNSCNLM
ncbi:hypothetical protein SUGI_0761590 [Cryptomeria japonica]|nr:hypothetical protein SUGI_0761590 [Cryptomeria japonica]